MYNDQIRYIILAKFHKEYEYNIKFNWYSQHLIVETNRLENWFSVIKLFRFWDFVAIKLTCVKR